MINRKQFFLGLCFMETTKNTNLQNHIGNKKSNTQPTQSSLGQCLRCRGGESRGAGWRLCQAPPWHGVWGSLTPSQAALPKESLEAPGHLCVCRPEDVDAHCARYKTSSSHLVTAQVISPSTAMQILVTWELAARTLGTHVLEPWRKVSSNTFSKIQAVQTRLLKICWRRDGLNLSLANWPWWSLYYWNTVEISDRAYTWGMI